MIFFHRLQNCKICPVVIQISLFLVFLYFAVLLWPQDLSPVVLIIGGAIQVLYLAVLSMATYRPTLSLIEGSLSQLWYLWVGLLCSALNALLPAKVGTVCRVALLKRHGLKYSDSLIVLSLFQICNVVLALLTTVALFLAVDQIELDLEMIDSDFLEMLAVFLFVVVTIVAVRWLRRSVMTMALRRWVRLLRGYALSTVVFSAILIVLSSFRLLVISGTTVDAVFSELLFITSLVSLSGLISVTPGGIVIREAALVSAFVLLGYSANEALPIAILERVIISATATGIILFSFLMGARKFLVTLLRAHL